MLAADHGAAYGEAAQTREHQQMDERLTLGPHVRRCQPIAKLVPGQRALVRKRPLDHGDATLSHRRSDSRLPQTARVGRAQGRSRQHVQPPVVLAPDQVQRPAVQPADDELPLLRQCAIEVGDRQPPRPRAQGEARTAQILGLHCQESPGDRDRVGGGLTQELTAEALCREVAHPGSRVTGRLDS